MPRLVKNLAAVFRLGAHAVPNLVAEIERRLPAVRAQLPVEVSSGRVVTLKLREGDEMLAMLSAFCDAFHFDRRNIPLLRQQLVAALNPDASVAPAQETAREQTAAAAAAGGA